MRLPEVSARVSQIFATSLDGYLSAIDGATGASIWRSTTSGTAIATPTPPTWDSAGSRLFVGSGDGKLYQLTDLANPAPTITSTQTSGAGAAGAGAVGSNLYYVGNESGTLDAISIPLP